MKRLTESANSFVELLLVGLLCAFLATSCSDEKAPRVRRALTDRDFAREAMKVKKLLGEDFIVEVERPFVLAGNVSRAEFNRIKNGTVLNCYQAFYRQFFSVRPNDILKVFLFRDDKTYREYARKLFDDEPTTPYGYYKREQKSLVMNIGTGTGTLVHEMVHALIETDFPDVPSWFNEGLGSLFEQCMVTEAGLKGLVNWRLPILQRAIEEKKLVSLRKLVSTTSKKFYGDERGTNYAEARYFCMYMQELGLLEKFYKEFRANFKKDPTGSKTLQRIFRKNLDDVQRDWLTWVSTLRR